MANKEHLKIFNKGVKAWNEWREKYPEIEPDLRWLVLTSWVHRLSERNLVRTNLSDSVLSDVYLGGVNLSEANLSRVDFTSTYLGGANLSNTTLYDANLSRAILAGANLSGANLRSARLIEADLSRANLRTASLVELFLKNVSLRNANLNDSEIGWSTFANVDLGDVRGFDTIRYLGPSTIGIDTIYKSGGKIPNSFLQGCGVPDVLMTYIPSLVGEEQAIQFYSCFISYSHKDEDFVKWLYSRMRDVNLRVWYAPEDIRGGEKIHEQIDRAIQLHDRLLIVLSENSIRSEWVMTEIRKARKTEINEKRRKLFPIRLVDMKTIQEWECFDVDTSKDLAIEVREYFIPDFSNWGSHNTFEVAFKRLLKDLRAAERG